MVMTEQPDELLYTPINRHPRESSHGRAPYQATAFNFKAGVRGGRPKGEETATLTVRMSVAMLNELKRRADVAGLPPSKFAERELMRRLAKRPGEATRRRMRRAR